MNQKRKTSKSWKKEMYERISKEMPFSGYIESDLMEKKNRSLKLRWMRRVVKGWTMTDVERVDDVLRNRRKMDPKQFSSEFNQIVLPLFEKCGKVRDIDGFCNLLSRVVGQRMCEESSEYSVWN